MAACPRPACSPPPWPFSISLLIAPRRKRPGSPGAAWTGGSSRASAPTSRARSRRGPSPRPRGQPDPARHAAATAVGRSPSRSRAVTAGGRDDQRGHRRQGPVLGHAGVLDTTVWNVRVVLAAGPKSPCVLMDADSRSRSGTGTTQYRNVRLAQLDTTTGVFVPGSWTGIKATMTEEGVDVFSSYSAGHGAGRPEAHVHHGWRHGPGSRRLREPGHRGHRTAPAGPEPEPRGQAPARPLRTKPAAPPHGQAGQDRSSWPGASRWSARCGSTGRARSR